MSKTNMYGIDLVSREVYCKFRIYVDNNKNIGLQDYVIYEENNIKYLGKVSIKLKNITNEDSNLIFFPGKRGKEKEMYLHDSLLNKVCFVLSHWDKEFYLDDVYVTCDTADNTIISMGIVKTARTQRQLETMNTGSGVDLRDFNSINMSHAEKVIAFSKKIVIEKTPMNDVMMMNDVFLLNAMSHHNSGKPISMIKVTIDVERDVLLYDKIMF